ncbi:MAG: phosphatidylglycerophosphatase A [Bacteroidetes bacterium]|nr:phosphatidylglycerophosphatase A [Bacteroidota bacterium]
MTAKSVSRLLGSCFGVGNLPVAPGTWGSLIPIFPFILIPGFDSLLILIPIFILITISGILIGSQTELYFKKDPEWFVLDEVAGQMIPLLLLSSSDYLLIGLSFVFFRFFDITKVLKINQLQTLPGGWGIMVDDLAAGLYTLILIAGLKWIGI